MGRNVVLVGFMAAGKSTVGRVLAERLGFDLVDTDAVVEARAGKPISRIFAEQGEEAFREMESEAAREVAGFSGHVIVTGGGIVLREENMAALGRAGPVFCLDVRPEEVLERTRGTDHRPLLQVPDPLARIRALLEERAPLYARADYRVETTGRSVEQVVEEILEILASRHPEIVA